MLHCVITVVLALACNTLVSASSQEPEWKFKIGVTTAKCNALYYINSKQKAPYAPNKTLGQLCQLAHDNKLPWCFLIAAIKTTGRPKQTCYYDAAILYKYLQFNCSVDPQEPLLKQFARQIAIDHLQSGDTRVNILAFNHYPDGQTTFIDPDNNALAEQVNYTVQRFDKKPADRYSFGHIVVHSCNRYNQLAFQEFWGEPTDAGKVASAKHEATFWLKRYRNDVALHDVQTSQMLSRMQAFRLLHN